MCVFLFGEEGKEGGGAKIQCAKLAVGTKHAQAFGLQHQFVPGSLIILIRAQYLRGDVTAYTIISHTFRLLLFAL